MRGKVTLFGICVRCNRITPAYAGKSHSLLPSITFSGDHPRVCGEKFIRLTLPYLFRGSPPRMRGKADFPVVLCEHVGITPAYAGKSFSFLAHTYCFRDHPRVCGEKRQVRVGKRFFRGSPPRMRGKVIGFDTYKGFFGITPAYAGKRGLPVGKSHSSWDHPRVCGEKRQRWKKERSQ